MKYMGSKRSMLSNGLGELLADHVSSAKRFADLFSGSAAVAIHVACRYDVQVLACDLQAYSKVLAAAVLQRKVVVPHDTILKDWHERALAVISKLKIPEVPLISMKVVMGCRAWCSDQSSLPITQAYGGHYFSPLQAVWLDALRTTLPTEEPARTIALAALIQSASQCAAAPGHTAQPFQPTSTAKKFLLDAWNRNALDKTRAAFETLAKLKANRIGKAIVCDAIEAACGLMEGDLAFIDPPYSGVHYSRFYHVLETVAAGSCGPVTGIGRYPDISLRPTSKFSLLSESESALDQLLETVASRGARAVLTFPDHECSNGLSGESVREIASKHFTVLEKRVSSRFSTLGGTSNKERKQEAGRSARRHAKELILVLNCK